MIDATTRLTSTLAALDRYDVEAPAGVVRAAETIQALRAVGDAQLDAAELADAMAGQEPAQAVKAFTRAVAAVEQARAAKAAAQPVIEQLARRALDTLRRDADLILDQYRPRFDAAARFVADSVAAGIGHDTDHAAIIGGGGDAAKQLVDVVDAERTLDGARELVAALDPVRARADYGVARFISPDRITNSGEMRRLDTMDGGGFAAYSALDDAERNSSWRQLVAAGHRLRLNTAAETDDVIAAHHAAEQAARDADAAPTASPGMARYARNLRRLVNANPS